MTGRQVKLSGAASAATAGILSRIAKPARLTTRVRFSATPARIALRAADEPLRLESEAHLSAASPLRLGVVTGDLCLDSDYEWALDLFDEPRVATFFVKGRTEVGPCRDLPSRRLSVGFADLPAGRTVRGPMGRGGVIFTPLGEPLSTADLGEPADRVKLVFPNGGLRVDFPESVRNVALRLNQYGASKLDFAVHVPDGDPVRLSRRFRDEERVVELPPETVTAVEITGGRGTSSLVEISFESTWTAVAPLRRDSEGR